MESLVFGLNSKQDWTKFGLGKLVTTSYIYLCHMEKDKGSSLYINKNKTKRKEKKNKKENKMIHTYFSFAFFFFQININTRQQGGSINHLQAVIDLQGPTPTCERAEDMRHPS
jgi:hypothetical protein